jgi:hypothetical protein
MNITIEFVLKKYAEIAWLVGEKNPIHFHPPPLNPDVTEM